LSAADYGGVGPVQQSAGTVIRLLLAGLAAVMLAGAGCGSGSEPTAQAPAAAQDPALPGDPTVAATARAGSLADVSRRLEARGYALEYGFPSGQATDAVLVTDSPGVDISAFDDPAAASTAFVAARRLLQFNQGHGLVELHAGTRVYLTSLSRLLSREDRAHFHAVVAAGEGTV
jgi:hypothetical protein